jgi:hypothetical protein
MLYLSWRGEIPVRQAVTVVFFVDDAVSPFYFPAFPFIVSLTLRLFHFCVIIELDKVG